MLALLEDLARRSTAAEMQSARGAADRAGVHLEGPTPDPRDLLDWFIEQARPLVRANRSGS